MKVKMKKTLIGATGNGEATITYEEGKTYDIIIHNNPNNEKIIGDNSSLLNEVITIIMS